uniref:Uncharacterized protein n=1 Tax=Ditylenchus dipsaci TaxID=166011 RepID=A0A915CTQ4_9BILA
MENNLDRDLTQIVTYILENENALPKKLDESRPKKPRLSEGCLDTTLQFSSPKTPVAKRKAKDVVTPTRPKNRYFDIPGVDVVNFLANEFSWMRLPVLRTLYRGAPNLVGLLITCFFFDNSLGSMPCFNSVWDYYRIHCTASQLNMAKHSLSAPRRCSSTNAFESPKIVVAVKQFEKKLMEIAASNPQCFEGLIWRNSNVTDLLSRDNSDAVFECLVCDNEIPMKNGFSCKSSGCHVNEAAGNAQPSTSKAVQNTQEHMFCVDCIRGQAKASVGEALLDPELRGIKCMASDCSNPILYEKIKAYLPRSIRYMLEKRIADQNVCTAVENLERCTKCGFAVIMEVPKEENKVFKCLSCDYEFCRYCELDWIRHFGLSCKEAEVKSGDALRKQTEIKLNEAVIRKCPSCHLAFVKESQCNKMRCRCGMTMCYICRTINIDYDHFCGHVRDPKIPNCTQCVTKRCLLWEDYRQYDEEAKKKFLLLLPHASSGCVGRDQQNFISFLHCRGSKQNGIGFHRAITAIAAFREVQGVRSIALILQAIPSLPSLKDDPDVEAKLPKRLQRFRGFASIEFEGMEYMSPQDFLDSLVLDEPKERVFRRVLKKDQLKKMLRQTPPLRKGSDKMFRNLGENGIISYAEYLFLLTLLTKSRSSFDVAFTMFDDDDNMQIDKFEFLKIRSLLILSVRMVIEPEEVVMPGVENIPQQWNRSHEELNALGISAVNSVADVINLQTFAEDRLEELMSHSNRLLSATKENTEECLDVSERNRLDREDKKETVREDTTIVVHLFGHNGRNCLTFDQFQVFYSNLQKELIEIEFEEFARGKSEISSVDFARLVLRYSMLHKNDQSPYIRRIYERCKNADEGITLQQFEQFSMFLNNLEDFTKAVRLYTAADIPVSRSEFVRAVKCSTGFELDAHLVDTLYKIFDANEDDKLSYSEFIAIMNDGCTEDLRTTAEGILLLDGCLSEIV